MRSAHARRRALANAIQVQFVLGHAAKHHQHRLPDDLVEALDERAAALGITRSQLIIQAVERALEDRSAWSPGSAP
jgi:hypothetical protein